MTELSERYPEVEQFAQLMYAELAANAGKGDQPGWRSATPDALLNDITWHWAKLAMAWRDWKVNGESVARGDAIREYAADVANMSLMFVDNLGLLERSESETSMVYIGGGSVAFRCDCGGNVFTRHGAMYTCNSCRARYKGEVT